MKLKHFPRADNFQKGIGTTHAGNDLQLLLNTHSTCPSETKGKERMDTT